MKVKSTSIDSQEKTLTITDDERRKHTLPLSAQIHVVMIGYPEREEKDMSAGDLEAYMSQGYIIQEIEILGTPETKPVEKWRYIQPGDMLEHRSLALIDGKMQEVIKQIGPVIRIHEQDGKHIILVPSGKFPGVEIAVQEHRLLAIFRDNVEVVRF